MDTKRFMLTRNDIAKWLQNSLIFLAPIALIYLAFVSDNLNDGLNAADFIPNNAILSMMVLYLVNVCVDFFRKLIGKKPA